jgi:hypothetical protein
MMSAGAVASTASATKIGKDAGDRARAGRNAPAVRARHDSQRSGQSAASSAWLRD